MLDAMARELVGCLDDGMDHLVEVEVILDLAAERRGVVVVEEGKGRGNAKGEVLDQAVATVAGVGRLDLNGDAEQQLHSAMEGMVVVAIRKHWYEV